MRVCVRAHVCMRVCVCAAFVEEVGPNALPHGLGFPICKMRELGGSLTHHGFPLMLCLKKF